MHKEINKKFYNFINTKYKGKYLIDDSEGFGRIYLISVDYPNDAIEYHQSRHTVCLWEGAKVVRIEANEMESFLNKLLKEYKLC